MQKIKVIVTDDHELILAGIENMLAHVTEIELIAGVTSGYDLLETIKNCKPDVVLMDIDMPGLSGLDTCKKIKEIHPEIQVIALTVHGEASMVKKAKESGMSGYFLKNVNQAELIHSIKSVFSGKTAYSSSITESLLNFEPENTLNKECPDLTPRELEIIQCIASGFSNTQIGEKLHISPRTVDTHRTNLMKKIGANNVASIVRYAIKNKIV